MSLQPPEGYSPSHEPSRAPSPLPPPPFGYRVIGGESVTLNGPIALDRLASGYGYLTIEWSLHQYGYDLLALTDHSTITARGNTLAVDVSRGFNRALIATGTQGTMTLPASALRISNGSTAVTVPLFSGTSLGMWPRVTLLNVDGFLVIRDERDPLSGTLSAVANAYGYDERNFSIAHTLL